MSAPPRPDDHNFFLLLELDPEEDSEVTIRAQIRKKRGEWSNDVTQGTEAVRNRAKTYQSLLVRLEEVMTDPGERATERAWAREIRETRRRAGRAELARRIAAIRVRGGPYTARDLAALEREFGGAFSRAEIERELVGAGVAAAEAAEAPGERAPRPALDPAKAKGIRQMLDEIGCADLYQFLGLGPGCTHETLGRRAEEILQEVYASGKRDQASSVRQNLAGRCKDVFRTPGEKERYDNSLATENLGRLDALIHLSGETGVVTAESLDFLVRQALELKIPREDAEDYVRAFAHRRKWRWLVAKGARLASDELRTCGACGRLAQDPAARNCGACGEPLTLACPQCGASVPTQNAACAGCGFRTGDA
jgi:hypothetical protein